MDNTGSYGFSSYHNGGTAREQDFAKLANTIESSIQKISQNVSSMQRMVNQLGTAQDSEDLRGQLYQIQHYTQQLSKDTNTNLQDLKKIPPPQLLSEQRQCKVQRERLAEQFTVTLSTFQNAQRLAAQKEKEQMQRTKAQCMGDPFASNRNNSQLIELQDSGSNKRQMQLQDDAALQLLQQQEQSIRQLENDISDVNQIFKDLGSLVHEQGFVVDSIESSVERTEVFVSEGVQQLRQASTYKNKLRKKKAIIAIIIAIILSVIITIIAVQLHN